MVLTAGSATLASGTRSRDARSLPYDNSGEDTTACSEAEPCSCHEKSTITQVAGPTVACEQLSVAVRVDRLPSSAYCIWRVPMIDESARVLPGRDMEQKKALMSHGKVVEGGLHGTGTMTNISS